MNRSTLPLLPLATALALALTAGSAAAQSLVRPPPSLTQPEPAAPAGGNAVITTFSTVTGAITQSSANSAVTDAARQTIGVGNVVDLREANGSVQARGGFTGSLVQARDGGGANVTQEVAIGRVSGLGRAQTITANGIVQASITQSASGAADATGRAVGGARQLIDVGGARDTLGGVNVESRGFIAGAGVSQSQQAGTVQEVRVGSIDEANVQGVVTGGTILGQVTQTSSGTGGILGRSQRVAVGSLSRAAGGSVVTQGMLSGNVSQTLTGDTSQEVEIATVTSTFSPSLIVAIGQVSGDVVQQASGSGLQRFSVAAVSGDVGGVLAQGTVTGNVTQVASGGSPQGSVQTISVSDVVSASGTVSTDASVGANLSQTISGNGQKLQQLRIASAANTGGATVSTRASVRGSVSQTLSDTIGVGRQRTEIGSVVGVRAGSIATDVVVDGAIVQAGNGSGSDAQTILLGSVTAD